MNKESRTRNIIAKSLGAFWILDGLLQFQPSMFGSDFVTSILMPSLNGQPAFLGSIISFGIFLWDLSPALMNTIAALIQVTIGILLFFPASSKKFRAGLYASIVWGIIVWIFGEGLGMLFTGSASLYTGVPGSVLLYVILSWLLLKGKKLNFSWLLKIAGWILVLGAALQMQPFFWSADGVQGSIMAASMEPFHFLNAFPGYVTNLLSAVPVAGNWVLVLLPLVIGLLLITKKNRIVGIVALVFLFFVWWLGQDFGMLTTLVSGTATDPNSAPLLGLFVMPLFF